ncbi:hypothetical protein BDV38DRAFT_24062 [Aspergillus pseudotamarii]|uniref:DUF1772-domain-containing protein n=1 Tax=Aspergillus pseudotamarii TaxID=132259 RepID=A0A5N6S9I6_ASPPS|nr:uncharacterized protein BDV38DRAFT_24062 [Aspergillus pseudotamarii]KAE8131376.1 hypothetical protein BDV38DRAFT_24062 [Aspergillus pseudotamarii]
MITALQATAVIMGSFMSGAMMSVYGLAMPAFLQTVTQSSQLIRFQRQLYLIGTTKGRALGLATTLLYSSVSVHQYLTGAHWRVSAAAGLITISLVPFTEIVMAPTNNALARLESETNKGMVIPREEAERLVRKWDRFNVVRALFPLAGGVLGSLGALQLVNL